MSVEDTLAERGARYGDFTEHATICQEFMRVMKRARGQNAWPDLSDVQRQSLTVIADKIARILSGDPDYADNWHDIQGYAKLVEDRLPAAPMTFHERVAEIDMSVQRAVEVCLARGAATHTMTNPPGEDIYAEFAARMGTTDRKIGKAEALGAGYKTAVICTECKTISCGEVHAATCSQLTAPEEYKAETQVAFDEAAEISEALARQVSVGTLGENHCPHCGAAEGAFHKTDCTVLRRGKSVLGQTIAEVQARQVSAGGLSQTPAHADKIDTDFDESTLDEYSAYAEPAAAMDDDSPRMQAIGQNGNDGLAYQDADGDWQQLPRKDWVDPFAGAPEWAKYKAQDADGCWNYYSAPPKPSGIDDEFKPHPDDSWWEKPPTECTVGGEPNPNWRDTLITRT